MAKTNNTRRFAGSGPRPDNTAHKQSEALERQAAWQKLSPVQQLKALDQRFGEGKGAVRQRARILSQLERAKNKPVLESKKTLEPVASTDGERIKAKDRRAHERQERPNK